MQIDASDRCAYCPTPHTATNASGNPYHSSYKSLWKRHHTQMRFLGSGQERVRRDWVSKINGMVPAPSHEIASKQATIKLS